MVEAVGVVGCGTIGASWAALFLAHGLEVRCTDPDPQRGDFVRSYVTTAWPALQALGVATGTAEAALARLSFSTDLEQAIAAVGFVQESGPERLDLKRALYARMESAVSADCLIASSTSGLMPSVLQAEMSRPERFLVGHPFNPPHLIPLVEVIGGDKTSANAINTAMAFYTRLGKRAIYVRKEVPGHIANRLQAALWREAVHLAAEGVASVADIDAAVVAGPGARWAIMGPHMTFHLAGGQGGMGHFIDHLGPAVSTWWADLGTPQLNPQLRDQIVEGVAVEADGQSIDTLGDRRDQALIELLKTVKPIS